MRGLCSSATTATRPTTRTASASRGASRPAASAPTATSPRQSARAHETAPRRLSRRRLAFETADRTRRTRPGRGERRSEPARIRPCSRCGH
eukprot:1449447-Prymnesium_polylepis.1